MNIYNDNRIVLTLDAGGTNFVFSAIQGGEEIVEPIVLPSNASDLELCLTSILDGFKSIMAQLKEQPAAISFAFPGPADYENGIIGDLPNFPSFRGGVALGPMLEEIFHLPTIINNDGDLFTYGEAVAGILPEINTVFGEVKTYRNLIGITLGTGFGGGIVINGAKCKGDNSAAGEMWLMRNFREPRCIAEEGISIRGVQRLFKELSGEESDLSPKEIYELATGAKKGDQAAAIGAFEGMAVNIAEALANAITLVDGPVVIGGGISGASEFLIPRIVEHLNGHIENFQGERIPRLVSKVYNLDDPAAFERLKNLQKRKIRVPFTNREVEYSGEKIIPIGVSRIGTSKAVSLGAYAVALDHLNETATVKSV